MKESTRWKLQKYDVKVVQRVMSSEGILHCGKENKVEEESINKGMSTVVVLARRQPQKRAA